MYNTAMDLTDIGDLRTAMQLAGITARKGLGQHFLVDREALEAVVAAGELGTDDTVVEVGPGLGVLTAELTSVAGRVIAIEKDEILAELLERDRPKNLEVVRQDALDVSVAELPKGYKVVANIPYYVTAPLFRHFLESTNPPRILSWLIQKEVAHRVTAEPGQMSVLALSVQYYGRPRLVEVVERHKFWPPPKVDSAVLQVKVYDRPAFEADPKQLFRLIKAGFGEKRKMLKNSLAGGLNTTVERAAELVTQAGLEITCRAQELSLGEWERLYNAALQAQLL